jgi:hypothetical protein
MVRQTIRNHYLLALVGIFLVWGFLNSARAAEAAAKVEPGAVEVCKKYLYAYADGNKELMRSLMAKEPHNYYGPCLFTEMPKLSNVRVRGGRAMIDFEGPSCDPALPRKGTIGLSNKDAGDGKRWRVRVIFWKGAQALSVNSIERSERPKDRAQEPLVRAAAEKYLQAWLKEDWKAMQAVTWDFLNKRAPLEKEVMIRSLSCRPTARPDGSVRVTFNVTASPRAAVINLLRRSATGHIYTVKENGEWKVRGITTGF